ncbi:hypothetical protein DSLASN_03470 [Desulfoluna limicola]|uniref:SAF domain-containing protein n=1 Tax=Desulfoluna limicola TaxID=2810562 RepID=A0ABM7PC40_9BACT|nr:flagellar basal body P-ring formation chaperone FlgA [Desulfoluna limicola]BCS94715.1 hypothetical protein DSLASN_03470 [Desulfoluna limicola]
MPWCLLIGVLLLLLPEGLRAESSLAMRPRVEVTGETVRVSDLFKHPLPAALKKHADTAVFNAPLPGKERFVPGVFLARKLSLLPGCKALKVKSPNRVCIVRKGQYLKDNRLEPLLEQVAKKTWNGPITITDLRVVGRRTFPVGKITLTPDKKRLRIRKNRIELPVAISAGRESMGRITLTGEVTVLKNVVVATTAIRQGDELTSDHVALAPRPVPPSDNKLVTELALAVGRMATRPIRPGTVLNARMVKASPLVERGEGVRIRYTLGGLVIAATGIAGETGGLGDFIKVKNSRSGKGITCRITGERTVEPLL